MTSASSNKRIDTYWGTVNYDIYIHYTVYSAVICEAYLADSTM